MWKAAFSNSYLAQLDEVEPNLKKKSSTETEYGVCIIKKNSANFETKILADFSNFSKKKFGPKLAEIVFFIKQSGYGEQTLFL